MTSVSPVRRDQTSVEDTAGIRNNLGARAGGGMPFGDSYGRRFVQQDFIYSHLRICFTTESPPPSLSLAPPRMPLVPSVQLIIDNPEDFTRIFLDAYFHAAGAGDAPPLPSSTGGLNGGHVAVSSDVAVSSVR